MSVAATWAGSVAASTGGRRASTGTGIRRAAARERAREADFDDLVRGQRQKVFRVALAVLGPGRAGEAEEVAQEALLRAYRALPSYRGESALASWLYRVTFNVAIDHLRRLRRSPEVDDEGVVDTARAPALGEPGVAGAASAAASPYEAARHAERSRRLHTALEKLADEPRAAVRLHYWMGHTVSEIAQLLGVPAGTVKSHLHRSRERLREELEDHET